MQLDPLRPLVSNSTPAPDVRSAVRRRWHALPWLAAGAAILALGLYLGGGLH